MTKQTCQQCILCGSGQAHRRHRRLGDFLRMRSAKYECQCCHGILYQKNRIAALLSKARHQRKTLAHSAHSGH